MKKPEPGHKPGFFFAAEQPAISTAPRQSELHALKNIR
jgi:hypothetical protein